MQHCVRLLLTLFFLLTLYIGYSQVVEEQKMTGSFQDEPISKILDQLSQSFEKVIYYQDQIELKRKTSLNYTEETLPQILSSLLKETTLGHIPYRKYAYIIMPRQVLRQTYSAEFYEAFEKNLDDTEISQKRQIGDITLLKPNGLTTITGTIVDAQNEEPIIGATIIVGGTTLGTITEFDGTYVLPNVPAGTQKIRVTYVGYSDLVEEVDILSDGSLPLELFKGGIELSEVTISARAADASVREVQIGVETMDVKTIEKLPTFMGEVDVVKSFILQPGVSTIGEGASGFNVRGGNVDQNLILQDEAILFNSSHALGFFSTFNTDLMRKVDLYKANIPAQFGGRLVSVLDVEMRDGNFEEFKLKAGIGPVSSKIMLEGPIIKNKVSFIGSFRSSYTDWLFKRFDNLELQRSSAFFYDGNFKLSAKLNEKHSFFLSGYTSQDDFTYNQEFGFDYATQFGELTYKYLINKKMINTISIVGSQYESTQLDLDGLDAAQIDNNVSYIKVKENFKIVPSDAIELNIGASVINYYVDPGNRIPGENAIITPIQLEQEKGRESSLYAGASWSIGERLQILGGARLAYFQFLGPHAEYQYENPQSPITRQIVGVENKTGTIASYTSPEPRVSLRLSLTDDSSIKMGYSRTSQFISQIFNSDSPTPTSQWQLSTRYIQPLKSHNASIGYFANFNNNNWETSLEFYARDIDQLFDFVDFATLLSNDHIETELVEGVGRAYGAEVSIKKNIGELTGWLSYTYARSERKIPEVNQGNWYLSNFDKTHDASLVLTYNPNQRNTLTANFNYSTGRPTTPPVGTFETTSGALINVYSKRNASRIPDYMRLDLAYTVGQGYKRDRKFKTSWTFSLYNVLGRKNPYSVFFTRGSQRLVEANRLAVLGTVFPSLTVNFELL